MIMIFIMIFIMIIIIIIVIIIIINQNNSVKLTPRIYIYARILKCAYSYNLYVTQNAAKHERMQTQASSVPHVYVIETCMQM